MDRDGALLVLIGLAGDAATELKRYEAAPFLAKFSPKNLKRLHDLSAAMRIAIEDVHRAQEAELAK